jgi:DNA polymerase-1
MIIERNGFKEIVEKLRSIPTLGLDLETTGLRAYHNDTILSAIVSDKDSAYYFNFQEYEGLDPKFILPKEWQAELFQIFAGKRVFMANPKFDLSFIRPADVDMWNIHDVLVVERLIRNDRLEAYSLGNVAKHYGYQKSDVVEEYIKKHKLWKWVAIPGKKSRVKDKFYKLVPFEIMAPYGLQDGRITYDIGIGQQAKLEELQATKLKGTVKSVFRPYFYETRLTPILWKMENRGILIDQPYCLEAISYLEKELKEHEQRIKTIGGIPDFRDSAKFLAPILRANGVELNKTEKGNDQIDSRTLENAKHPLCDSILLHRETHKRLNTYFRAFIYHADVNGVVHTNFRQGGTATGRMSSSDPNLQNQTAEEWDAPDVHPYPVKKAFIPRPGRKLYELDYDQMEFRLMLLYAGQWDLVRRIREGHDPHQATADITGLTRKLAKTLNFAVLYGTGVNTIAKMIGCTPKEAKEFKLKYFDALPKVEQLIRYISNQAKKNGYISTWDGRVYHFTDPNFAYKAVNYAIQGGCAGIVKQAMIGVDNELQHWGSDILVQVHDSLLLEVDEGQDDCVFQVKEIMENVRTDAALKLTVSVDKKDSSWHF